MGQKEKSEYAAKFKDPRWQKKRLEVMDRDGFACVVCDATDVTLNVHHCFYEWGNDPWEYPLASLITLCEECHEVETNAIKQRKQAFVDSLACFGLISGNYGDLAKAIVKRFESWGDPVNAFCVLRFVLNDDEAWEAAAMAYEASKHTRTDESK